MTEKFKKYVNRNCHYCKHYDETKEGGVVFPCKLGGCFGFEVDANGKTWCLMKNKDINSNTKNTPDKKK